MKKFKVKVRYTFEGWYKVEAEDEYDAQRIADSDCGLVLGGDIHTSNSMHVKDWEFDTHPDTQVISAKLIK